MNQIDKIRELILNAPTPFSMGLSGRWGSGKTSIMKYLMASLGGEPVKHELNFIDKALEEQRDFTRVLKKYLPTKEDGDKFRKQNIHTVWFNPWENENHQEPMMGLLEAIHHHFSQSASNLKKSQKLASVTLKAGLDMLGSLTKLGKVASDIKKIGDEHEHEHFQYTDRQQKFKFIFHEAIEILLKKDHEEIHKDARIVIFIDDLDRCEDQTIGKLLKEIKQYLSTKHCIFVFGYDRHHIEKSLLNTGTKTSKETRSYLEKLFQATFYIREPKIKQLKTFTEKTVKSYRFTTATNAPLLCDFISSIIDPNPRRIKTFLMAIYFHVLNYPHHQKTKKLDIDTLKKLILMAYMKHFYESAYSALENQPLLITDLLSAFKNRNVRDNVSQREYFFLLEFKAHLHDIDIPIDVERIEQNQAYEDKFLCEVYDMQGKHKSFEQYMIEFVQFFENETNLTDYL